MKRRLMFLVMTDVCKSAYTSAFELIQHHLNVSCKISRLYQSVNVRIRSIYDFK